MALTFRKLTPEYLDAFHREQRAQFPTALYGAVRNLPRDIVGQLEEALSAGNEEQIQRLLTAHPYLIQYAIDHSGHHGIWAFPKQMIKMRSAGGASGMIPDFLTVTRSSLGYFWHIVELKRPDIQFANAAGDGYSSEGHKAVAQCNGYLSHFQDYIDSVRSGIGIPELIQPQGAVIIMGDSDAETGAQQTCRADFVRNNSRISVVSYRRIITRAASDVGQRSGG